MTIISSREQFDAHAAKYASSPVHRSGPSLPVLVAFAAPVATDRALDVATGTGHTALALAPYVAQVTGVDLAPLMLEHARAGAAAAHISNVSFIEAPAEHLPFPDASVTLVTSRHAPHHFHDLDAFLREVRRVLAPGGRFVLADQITPALAHTAWVDRWQRLRDPSHVAQRTVDEWRALCNAAGLVWEREQIVPYTLDFAWWVRQSGCDEATIDMLRAHAQAADPDTRAALGLTFGPDGAVQSHCEPMLVARMGRPATAP